MTAVQLVAILVRLFALWLAMRTVLEVPAIVNFMSHEKDVTFRLISLAVAILSLVFCLLLWKFPAWISRKIIPVVEGEDRMSMSSNEFLSVGIILVGIWTVFDALPFLVRQYLLAKSSEYGDMTFGVDFYSYIYALTFKVIIGAWLILGAPGFRKMLDWIRTAGVKY